MALARPVPPDPTAPPLASPSPATLEELAGRSRPGAMAGERLLEVLPAIAPLLPGGLRRGTTLAVGGGPGATSLALALLAGPSRQGSWCAVVGLAELGLVAAAGLGVELGRLALVPLPGTSWVEVTGALLDGLDVVVVRPPARVAVTDARRLAARARHRGAVLEVLTRCAPEWPERTDARLTVVGAAWEGLGEGGGHLRGRRLEVRSEGRGAAARGARAQVWLPSAEGAVVP